MSELPEASAPELAAVPEANRGGGVARKAIICIGSAAVGLAALAWAGRMLIPHSGSDAPLDRSVQAMSRQNPTPADHAGSPAGPADAEAEQALHREQLIAAGDESLRELDWEAAWSAYEAARRIDESGCPAELRFRLGLAAEQLEEFALALTEYGEAAAASAPALRVSALLGEARMLQQLEEPEESRRILAELWRLAGRIEIPPELAADCDYARAEFLARECSRQADAPPWSDAGILAPDSSRELAVRRLAISQVAAMPGEPREPAASGVHVVQEHPRDPDGIEVRIRLAPTTVENAFLALCSAGGYRTLWTPAAKQAVIGKSLELNVPRTSLAECLDVLSAEADLSWTAVGTEIQVAHRDEVAVGERVARERKAAARALSACVLRHSDRMLTPRALLWLGNLAAIEQHPSEAAAYYEQLLSQFPRAARKLEAWFNLAKVRLALGDPETARDAFYHVIDSGREDRLAALADLYVGRLLLESGDARRATQFFREAALLTQEQPVHGLAVLGISAACLMADDPAAADLALMEHRADLTDPAFRDAAAFLGAAARHRAAREPRLREREARTLLFAVVEVDPSDFFGSEGWYLISRAYADVGLDERAAEVREQALSRTPRPAYADRMLLELAESHLHWGRVDEAKELLAHAADHADRETALAARIQLCELSASSSSGERTAELCRELLNECTEDAHRRRLLRILGQLYQQAGDYTAAAMCFTGSDPNSPLPADPVSE